MNIEGQNNSQPYKLGNGSGNRNNVLNYAKKTIIITRLV